MLEAVIVAFTLFMVYLRATGKINLKWQWITAPVWIYSEVVLFLLLTASIALGTIPGKFMAGIWVLMVAIAAAVAYCWE